MTKHLWSLHWMDAHRGQWEFGHVRRMGYRAVKVFEDRWNNADFCHELLAAAPSDCLFVARDWAMSEQKDDMWHDPAGTGRRHADEWSRKIDEGKYHLPPARSVFLGINEPDTISGDRKAIDDYNVAFLDRLANHGLCGGGLSFGVGHPRTVDGTPNMPRDWSLFQRTHAAIVRGEHYLILHEYGAWPNPGWGYWLCGYESCPWPDVRILIGECGIDQHVADGQGNRGWKAMGVTPEQYTAYLDEYHARLTSDSRIHSAMPFTFDFKHPWSSFDVRDPQALPLSWETYPWAWDEAPPPPQNGGNFERAVDFVLGQEGGYTPGIPGDPGGETHWGISKGAHPNLDIKNLTREQAIQIYRDEYWNGVGADAYPWPMNLILFDAAVQHGVGAARNILKTAGDDPLAYMGERLRFYSRIPHFDTFGRAWTRRMGDLLTEAAA